jgi:formate hydrogenlyase subunit 5
VSSLTEVRTLGAQELASEVASRVGSGARFVGLWAQGALGATGQRPAQGALGATGQRLAQAAPSALFCVLHDRSGYELLRAQLPFTEPSSGQPGYPALTPLVPGADWHERAIYDLWGLRPLGHPRLSPLVHLCASCDRCLSLLEVGAPEVSILHYGPVRSGVVESVGFLLHSPGEEILHVDALLGYKRRNVEARFSGKVPSEAIAIAERVEGPGSVAHALAFARAVESLGSFDPPERVWFWRVLHVELERIAAHLHALVGICEAGALAVGAARFSYHKERVQQLRARLGGSRFSRRAVVPGDPAPESLASAMEEIESRRVLSELVSIGQDIARDEALLMQSASLLDRIRGAGPLSRAQAERGAATGIVARGSGIRVDAREDMGIYAQLGWGGPRVQEGGDGLARQIVRFEEMRDSVSVASACLERLASLSGKRGHLIAPGKVGVGSSPGKAGVGSGDEFQGLSGWAVGVSEAPQGECVYVVHMEDGVLREVFIRSGSFQNLSVFASMFHGDIFTDFAFNEAGLEVSFAGASL